MMRLRTCSLISCDCQDPSIRISDPMWRLERLCGPCRHWIQGSAWWDGIWQAGPDVEGERILEYALAFDLLLGNTFQET